MFILNKLFSLWAEVVTQLRKHCQMPKHTKNILLIGVNTAAAYRQFLVWIKKSTENPYWQM
jgi:hypothetical protein